MMFDIGSVDWSDDDLRNSCDEFVELYTHRNKAIAPSIN